MAIKFNVAIILNPSNLSANLNWGVFKAFEVLSCNSSSRMPDGPEDQGSSGRIHSALDTRRIKVYPAGRIKYCLHGGPLSSTETVKRSHYTA